VNLKNILFLNILQFFANDAFKLLAYCSGVSCKSRSISGIIRSNGSLAALPNISSNGVHYVVAFTDVLYDNCIYGNSLSQSSIRSFTKDVSAALFVRSSLSDNPSHSGCFGVVLSRSISKN
jgi:hypothetical protein